MVSDCKNPQLVSFKPTRPSAIAEEGSECPQDRPEDMDQRRAAVWSSRVRMCGALESEVVGLRSQVAELQRQTEDEILARQAAVTAKERAEENIEAVERQRQEVVVTMNNMSSAFREHNMALEQENSRLAAEVARLNAERGPSSASASGSEGVLRAALAGFSTGVGACSLEELRNAIGSVTALLEEARRELSAREHRERRAAYERLYEALESEDEESLVAAMAEARRNDVDEVDIDKAAAKLEVLRTLTAEEREARKEHRRITDAKRRAFVLVKNDDPISLEKLLQGLGGDVDWKAWRDHSGRTLILCARMHAASQVIQYLERLRGQPTTSPRFVPAPDPAAVSATCRESPAPGSGAPEGTNERGKHEQSAGAILPGVLPRHGDRAGGFSSGHWSSLSTMDPETPTAKSEPDSSSRCLERSCGSSKPSFCEGHAGERPLLDGRCLPADGALDASTTGVAAWRSVARGASMSPKAPEAVDDEELMWRQAGFRAVVQNDTAKLQEVLGKVPQEVWSTWQNKAGKDLITLAQERGSSAAYAVMARAMGLIQERKHAKLEAGDSLWVMVPGDMQPRRATAVKAASEDDEEVLVEYWDGDAPPCRVPHVLVSKLS